MSRNRRNGYASMPALLVAGAFVLPLLSRTAEWFGLPRELRVVLPLLLGAAVLAGVEQLRRNSSADDHESEKAGEADAAAGHRGESQSMSK